MLFSLSSKLKSLPQVPSFLLKTLIVILSQSSLAENLGLAAFELAMAEAPEDVRDIEKLYEYGESLNEAKDKSQVSWRISTSSWF